MYFVLISFLWGVFGKGGFCPGVYVWGVFVPEPNNSAFDKRMENVRKYRDIKFATARDTLGRSESKPNFNKSTIFNTDSVAVSKLKFSP